MAATHFSGPVISTAGFGGVDTPTSGGTGITAGTGTVLATSIVKQGDVFVTRILLDLTGLDSDATEGDIIGVDGTANPCYIHTWSDTNSGTAFQGTMTCLETPAGGEVDIDLYEAEEATGVTDGAIGDLTETALVTAGADWAAETVQTFANLPTDGEYWYLTVGSASTPTAGTYTAGKFLIEIFGT